MHIQESLSVFKGLVSFPQRNMEDYAFGRINGIWRLWDVKYNTRTMEDCAQSHFSHQICAALRAKVLRTFWQLWQLELSIKKFFFVLGYILIPTQDSAISTWTDLQALCPKNNEVEAVKIKIVQGKKLSYTDFPAITRLLESHTNEETNVKNCSSPSLKARNLGSGFSTKR